MAIIWVSFVRSRVGTKILETLKPVSSNPSASSLFAKASRACSSAAKRSAVACACFENGEKFSSTFLIASIAAVTGFESISQLGFPASHSPGPRHPCSSRKDPKLSAYSGEFFSRRLSSHISLVIGTESIPSRPEISRPDKLGSISLQT